MVVVRDRCVMDRLQWSTVLLSDDENFIYSADGLKLYDGDDKVHFGILSLSDVCTFLMVNVVLFIMIF